MTGSVKITVALALVLLIGLHAHYLGVADAAGSVLHSLHEQRWILLLSLIAKVYVSEALASNIQYSGSYEQ